MSVSQEYMSNRKAWQRPQAMIWADYAPVTNENGFYLPYGYERLSDQTSVSDNLQKDAFIILSDHNRQSIDITAQRIEQRQRMANGSMRSYHIADKLTLTTSWNMLPSRSFKNSPNFDLSGNPDILTPADKDGLPPDRYYAHLSEQYTADGGAGGVEILKWYNDHPGSFWVLLSYDRYDNYIEDGNERNRLGQYSQAIRMFVSQFDYSIQKRGGNNFDMWNITVTLEEA